MLSKLRIIFQTEKPLGRQFRPERTFQKCPKGCKSCTTSSREGTCFQKFAVYKITCNICGRAYIGLTARTIRSRILEHIASDNSYVHRHMIDHGSIDSMNFTWRILTVIRDNFYRYSAEALYIKKQQPSLNSSIVNSGQSLFLSLY